MATVIIKKYCKKCGCKNFATTNGYCEAHWLEYEKAYQEKIKRLKTLADKKRLSPSKRGYDHKWNCARKVFLIEHPICARCGQPATVVDHIIPHKGNHDLFWDRTNWQALCKTCHDKKTYFEDGGFGRVINSEGWGRVKK